MRHIVRLNDAAIHRLLRHKNRESAIASRFGGKIHPDSQADAKLQVNSPPSFASAAHTFSPREAAAMPGEGLEPTRIAPPDPKSGASANSATRAY